ncbi:hypothetical protein EIN_252790 [Entamoeba invadens IP1]|uniref:Uncharacterized protein n=1 Tax=Entamoeba invadens IP1 TaxID=370355 RepID=A0A0A1UEP9_ENTIV|nr:hypothetical protein EIN_252790 [Entamoeba invadens IP1]ELP95035.1 hypothetical protein EIN_252790 [Entamoeba invadens IP1]|eukprot:XP_004261806.1 hypothetical protein EIN_252790 [Entamoeba invadens IP1]
MLSTTYILSQVQTLQNCLSKEKAKVSDSRRNELYQTDMEIMKVKSRDNKVLVVQSEFYTPDPTEIRVFVHSEKDPFTTAKIAANSGEVDSTFYLPGQNIVIDILYIWKEKAVSAIQSLVIGEQLLGSTRVDVEGDFATFVFDRYDIKDGYYLIVYKASSSLNKDAYIRKLKLLVGTVRLGMELNKGDYIMKVFDTPSPDYKTPFLREIAFTV